MFRMMSDFRCWSELPSGFLLGERWVLQTDRVSRITYREPNSHQAVWVEIPNTVTYLTLVLVTAGIWVARGGKLFRT